MKPSNGTYLYNNTSNRSSCFFYYYFNRNGKAKSTGINVNLRGIMVLHRQYNCLLLWVV